MSGLFLRCNIYSEYVQPEFIAPFTVYWNSFLIHRPKSDGGIALILLLAEEAWPRDETSVSNVVTYGQKLRNRFRLWRPQLK